MSEVIVEVEEHTAEITIPTGGDPRTAASIKPAFQGLANRSALAKDRLDQHGDDINALEALTAPLEDGGTLNPDALLKLGTNVAFGIFATSATTSTPATFSAFRRLIEHINLGAAFDDTLDEDGAVAGDWVIICQGGSGDINVKTESGTELAVLNNANGNTGLFYFNTTAGEWRLAGLMRREYDT